MAARKLPAPNARASNWHHNCLYLRFLPRALPPLVQVLGPVAVAATRAGRARALLINFPQAILW
jgi:hypothetical protein